jgi:hypothetical protein
VLRRNGLLGRSKDVWQQIAFTLGRVQMGFDAVERRLYPGTTNDCVLVAEHRVFSIFV